MRSHGWLAVALATGLSACSGAGNGAKALPPVAAPATTVTIAPSDAQVRDIQCHVGGAPAPNGATTGRSGQEVAVYPQSLQIAACATEPALFDAYENFSGEVRAYSEDPSVATVGPDAQLNSVVPTYGGLKNAWFVVVPQAAGTTRIVVIDKRGNRAYVDVTVTPCPRLAPPPPPPIPPTPAASPAPCSAARQALGTRQTATGATGSSCTSPAPSPSPSA